MSLMHIIMSLLKPSDTQLKARKKTTLVRLKIRVYRFLLNRLAYHYHYYAVSDTVSTERSLRIIHDFRDDSFEKDLKRMGIDIRPHMIASSFPIDKHRKRKRLFYHYFKWEDVLTIKTKDGQLGIIHDGGFALNGNLDIDVKVSSSDDVLNRCSAEVRYLPTDITKAVQRSPENPKNDMGAKTVKKKRAQTQKPNSIFGRDIIHSKDNEPDRQQDIPIDESPASAVIAKKGFEIDSSF